MTIYELGLGNELANPVKKNHREIHSYLRVEKLLLNQWSAHFDYVIEVGCTYGRYAATIAQLNKQYIGIDIVRKGKRH